MDSFYLLDGDDIITQTGGWWDQFAQQNDGSASLSEAVEGRALWGFVSGEQTRDYLGAVLGHVRETGQTALFPYRCDSPAQPRLFQMIVDPMPRQALVVRHRLVQRFMPTFVRAPDDAEPHGGSPSHCPICYSVRLNGASLDPADHSGSRAPHDGLRFCPDCSGYAQAS